jgi:large subunit ribosomal protein L9
VEVILLEKVRNLGNLGDKVNVKGGFGRNYLIPSGKAKPATRLNIAEFEEKRAELEAASEQRFAQANERKVKFEELTVSIAARAADEGKLYGSIGPREVAQAITKLGVELNKSEVDMPLGAIHQTGEYTVELQLHTDVSMKLQVTVTAEE